MLKVEDSYIQYAIGYDKDGVTSIDIDKALNDLILMDDEHASFWVGVYGASADEYILEVHKDLMLFGNFGEFGNYKLRLPNLELSKLYFDLLLNGMIEELIINF
jgi:hypothetical protein